MTFIKLKFSSRKNENVSLQNFHCPGVAYTRVYIYKEWFADQPHSFMNINFNDGNKINSA